MNGLPFATYPIDYIEVHTNFDDFQVYELPEVAKLIGDMAGKKITDVGLHPEAVRQNWTDECFQLVSISIHLKAGPCVSINYEMKETSLCLFDIHLETETHLEGTVRGMRFLTPD